MKGKRNEKSRFEFLAANENLDATNFLSRFKRDPFSIPLSFPLLDLHPNFQNGSSRISFSRSSVSKGKGEGREGERGRVKGRYKSKKKG